MLRNRSGPHPRAASAGRRKGGPRLALIAPSQRIENPAAATLLLSANPGLTVDQLEGLLLAAATDMGPAGPDNQYGHGLMNLDAGPLFADGFESGDTSAWSATVP